MQPIEGHGTLTFGDGTAFDVYADLKFQMIGDRVSGRGKIKSDQLFAIGMMSGDAVLNVAERKIGVIVGTVHSVDYADITASGKFIE